MRLTFLGTGTSQGVPCIGCLCEVCQSADPRNRRSRTSALLQIGGQFILIDAGPDFRSQALAVRLTRLDAVLLTHAHYDHTGGLDDLRALTDRQGPIPIYGDAFTLQHVQHRYHYAFANASRGSGRPLLDLVRIDGPFVLAGRRCIPFEVVHGSWTITGYRFGSLAYVTDASDIPPASLDLLAHLEVLVLNALRFKPHPTHFSLQQSLAVIEQLRPKQAFLVHMTHDIDHAKVSDQLPPGVELAWDGLSIEIAEGPDW